MKSLYLETNSGISGDMTVAALLDLGADEQVLRDGLASLNVDGYDIKISRTQKCGITACDFDVILHQEQGHDHAHGQGCKHGHGHAGECGGHGHGQGQGQGHGHHCCANGGKHKHSHERAHEHSHDHDHDHDHDHSHSHGHEHNHDHEHSHGHGHNHDHAGDHSHSHGHSHEHAGGHAHRGIVEITSLIHAAALTENAKRMAIRIFDIIAKAEAKVHGLPVDEVHFHEVGAVDSIVDIVGAAICLDNLGVEQVFCTPLREGQGTVWCQHGRVPVPAPATLEIVTAHKIPLIITQNDGEMVTPTGAAIVAALCERFGAPDAMTVVKTGYGAGKKDFKVANVLRASIVEVNGAQLQAADEVLMLACNLDDMTAEQLACACEIFLENGALDCWQTAAAMKKGRQGVVLNLLIKPEDEEKFTRLLFAHTSTIGVRITHTRRRKMTRQGGEIETAFGTLAVKECTYGDICKTTVEYESAKKLATLHNIPIGKIYAEAQKHLK